LREDVLAMFEEAYRDRSPLFGHTPTHCVVVLSKMLSPGSRVADIGCGDGRDSLFLLEQGCGVVALDICRSAIVALLRMAKERGVDARLEAVAGNVTDWMPEPSSLDAVVGITILDHLRIENHQQVFNAINAGLKPGGIVALEMHSDRDPGERGDVQATSEFVQAIQAVSADNYLVSKFIAGWRILAYSDRMEWDYDHGATHQHGFVTLIAQKEANQ